MESGVAAERTKRYIAILAHALFDMAAVAGAVLAAVLLRFEHLPVRYITAHLTSAPIVLLCYPIIFYFCRLYRYRWQFAGLEIVWSVVLGNVLATALSIFWQWHIDGEVLPRSVMAMTLVLTTAFVGGQRLLLRVVSTHMARERSSKPRDRWQEEPKRTVILGSGQSAVDVSTALTKDGSRCELVGMLDDDVRYHGSFQRGVKILGGLHLLHDLLRQHAVDEVIIALPNASGHQLREYVLACCQHKVAVRVVPIISALLENPSASRGKLRVEDVTVEDLLHRRSVQVQGQEAGEFLAGKRVLVTGAGGSIGSELCRQIARCSPEWLILLGHGENSVHLIERELHGAYPADGERLHTVICDIRDTARLDYVYERYRPQVVFHAAAHKHVPLMEGNAAEAINNNVLGTRNVIAGAVAHNVERFLQISTDKAVNPSSVMGATKFLCEEMVRAACDQGTTEFVTVRFGNVLGSRGSVLPTFQQQILRGGPVTVTHPEMERYFMTIPEAASLVLQACATGESGSIFILDMGKPIRILDLAEDVIRLSGLEPYRDIAIEFCGLRPGEKLSEELFTDQERQRAQPVGRMFVVQRPQYIQPETLPAAIATLQQVAAGHDDVAVLTALADIIPTFRKKAATSPSDAPQSVA